MPLIRSNEYGTVSVNNSVLSKLIVDNMLSMSNLLVPCNRRGKVLRRGFFSGFNEMLNSVEISDNSGNFIVKVYFVLLENSKYEQSAKALFDMIEDDFELLNLDRPIKLIANVKGIIRNQILSKKDTEIVRQNDR